MSDAIEAEVVVVGGGPAGLTAAIALAAAGVETALVSPRPRSDNRTTALLMGSVTALDTLGVWRRCRDNAAALCVMRIIDGMVSNSLPSGHDAVSRSTSSSMIPS